PNVTFAATATSPSLTATGASAISVDSGNSAADVNLVIYTAGGFAGTLATTGGTISVAPTGNGTLTFANSGVGTATLNMNGGQLNVSSASSVTVGASVTLSNDNHIVITTPQLTLGSVAKVFTSGASLAAGVKPTIYVTSPVGSNLTVQLPSGSSATMEATGFVGPASGFVNAPNVKLPASINFVPASGQTLTFVDQGPDPTTLQNNGILVTSTVGVSTTIGTGVSLSANGPIAIFVKNSTLFNNGEITSSCPAAQGFNSWRTVNVSGNNGSVTVDGVGGVFSATGIPSPTI